jgi:ribose transport system permease protein
MTGTLAKESLPRPHWSKAIGARLSHLPVAYAGTAALLVCAGLARPNLLQPFLLLLILRQAAPLGVAVIGQSICVRLLSLDLSFGGVAMAVSYIMTSGYLPFSPPVLMIVCILFGAAIGAINAFFITLLRASSVIVTLAMVLILSGIVTAFSQFRAPGECPEILRYLGQTRIGILPVMVLVWFAVLIPMAIVLRKSVFGRYVDAIGSNPRAAWASGIPYVKVIFVAHILSSVFAVLSAFLLLGFVGFGSLSIGSDLALNSLAAVILGGVTFGSGRGGMIGPAVAAFMLMFSFNLLTSFGLGEPGKQMAQGAIIALAAIAYAARGSRQTT